MKKELPIYAISIAYYKESDWERLLKSIVDREYMHDTWKEWHNAYLEAIKEMKNSGFKINEIVVDIDELNNYCRINGIKNDASSRSRFVTPNNL